MKVTMALTEIPPQNGVGFCLKRGAYLKVTDVFGEQVADLICYAANDRREWLSSGRTIDYNETIYQTTGHTLYSNRSHPMLRIVEDRVGRHDFLLTPCSLAMFHVVSGRDEYHPSCQENLEKALAPYGVAPDNIPTTFNIFMNVGVGLNGALTIDPPRSKRGDFIVFEALMDLVVGLTACSDEQTNNGSLKPITYEVLSSYHPT